MRQNRVTPKIVVSRNRVSGLSRCTFTFTIVLGLIVKTRFKKKKKKNRKSVFQLKMSSFIPKLLVAQIPGAIFQGVV